MIHPLKLIDLSSGKRCQYRPWRSGLIAMTGWAIASGLILNSSPSWAHEGHPHSRGSETPQESMPEMESSADSASGSHLADPNEFTQSGSMDHDAGAINTMESESPELLMNQGATVLVSSPTSLVAVNPTITIQDRSGVGELSLGAIVVMPALLMGMKGLKKHSVSRDDQ